MPTLYLHIGLSKTASTYLQKSIFPLIESKSYLDRPRGTVLHLKYGQQYVTPAPVLTGAFRRSPKVWSEMGEALFDSLEEQLPDSDRPESLIISDECADSSGDPTMLYEHLSRFTELAKIRGFGRVRILVVIRRQAERMASLYAQLSDRIRGASQRNFEAWIHELLDPKRALYDRGFMYNYDEVYNAVSRVVGEEDLLMLPYEQLQMDPSGFVGIVAEYFEATEMEIELITDTVLAGRDKSDQNVRSLSHNSWKLRHPTKLSSSTVDLVPAPIFRLTGKQFPVRLPDLFREDSIELTAGLHQEIMSLYSVSNDRLKQYIPDLDRFGY